MSVNYCKVDLKLCLSLADIYIHVNGCVCAQRQLLENWSDALSKGTALVQVTVHLLMKKVLRSCDKVVKLQIGIKYSVILFHA